jgi:ribosomal protein S18 acetylase RimI-like enzyme
VELKADIEANGMIVRDTDSQGSGASAGPVIRRANDSDAATISSLNADVQALHAAALPWRFKPPGAETFPPAAAAALLANPDNLVFVAEVESVPVGYAYAEIMRRAETPFCYAYEMVYLHHISVRPAHRGRGIGETLLAAVRSAAAARDISLLTLDVWSFNKAARGFFRRCGFAPYNERPWPR